MTTKKAFLIVIFCIFKLSGFSQSTVTAEIDSGLIALDSIEINNQLFFVTFRDDKNLYIFNSKGDTVVIERDLYAKEEDFNGFKFLDFNQDGFSDIIISYTTNVPAIKDLLLFDKSSNTFHKVLNFPDFPASEPISGTEYYYSYHRSGCADMNWDSDLFYINNYTAKRIGNIEGHGCDNRDKKDGIYVHKIIKQKEVLISTFPIDTITKYENSKWGFIQDYWTKNYSKFIR